MTSLTLEGADARLRVRVREEEHNGSLFAFRGRLVALGLVALWLQQVFGRRTLFLYLVIYLTASALSYSARTVVLTGAASLVALVGSFVWTALDQARASGVDLLAAANLWADLWPTARALFFPADRPRLRDARGLPRAAARLHDDLHRLHRCRGVVRPRPSRKDAAGRGRTQQPRALLLAQPGRPPGRRRARF